MNEKSAIQQTAMNRSTRISSYPTEKDPSFIYYLFHPPKWDAGAVVFIILMILVLCGLVALVRFLHYDMTVEKPLREAAEKVAEQTKQALLQGKLDMPNILRNLLEEVKMMRKAVQTVVGE